MKKFIFPEDVINSVLAYLGSRPFIEVNDLIFNVKTSAVEFKEEVKDEKAE